MTHQIFKVNNSLFTLPTNASWINIDRIFEKSRSHREVQSHLNIYLGDQQQASDGCIENSTAN